MIKRNEITNVGPLEIQYMCPCGFGMASGNIVMIRDIPYNERIRISEKMKMISLPSINIDIIYLRILLVS